MDKNSAEVALGNRGSASRCPSMETSVRPAALLAMIVIADGAASEIHVGSSARIRARSGAVSRPSILSSGRHLNSLDKTFHFNFHFLRLHHFTTTREAHESQCRLVQTSFNTTQSMRKRINVFSVRILVKCALSSSCLFFLFRGAAVKV